MPSDRRLKENITDLTSQLENISSLYATNGTLQTSDQSGTMTQSSVDCLQEVEEGSEGGGHQLGSTRRK